MRYKKKSEIKVGLTILLTTILLVWIITWAKNIAFFSDENELLISFDTVAGLEVGDIVTVNGVRKGNVTSIYLKKQSVMVDISISKDVTLYSDATFSIMMLDLMGGKKVEIFPGSSENLIDYSVVQNGIFTGDISTTMVTLNSIQSDFVSVIKDVKLTLQELNILFDKGNLRNEILISLKSARKATDNLTKILKENQQYINELLVQGSELTRNTNSFIINNQEKLGLIFKDIQLTINRSEEMQN
jgi:phospholipid/cholesterol/gamma-HCH transport system substrate-binding protein